ncbi:hypothetical protein F2Q69_00027260 [Brassica cretica]|uniref:Uncharacterized protein n=1 Tax=Brassica cretica TaxID=69181 RepID=A0A8S9RT17_BRACR|nr:hypothetical protein F2Q69_00027260 [Brassica cretica]
MVKKTKGKLDAEKQEAERKESTLRGKVLASKLAGFGTQRTSRQQTLAAKKSKEQEKRAGKSVAFPTNEENDDESEDEQAPTKKAKMSKGKASDDMKSLQLQSEVTTATPRGRSGLCRFETRKKAGSDVPQRLPQVAPRPVQVPMVKKIKGKLDAEKQEAERKESALRGKVLASKLAGFGTQRTSRQQTLAAKKSKEQEKRAGKSVAVPTNEENDDETRSLRSDRAVYVLGRYVATELLGELGRYVATEPLCKSCGISEDARILAKRQILGSRIKVFDTMPRDVRDQCAGFRAKPSDRASGRARSLRSDRAVYVLGRFVATELWSELGRYVANKLRGELGRYVANEPFCKLGGFLKKLEYWQRDKFWDLVSRFLILCLKMLETSALGLGQDLGLLLVLEGAMTNSTYISCFSFIQILYRFKVRDSQFCSLPYALSLKSDHHQKFKQHLYVDPASLVEAADYYVESFGSVKKKGFFFPHCIELFVADTTLVLSEGIKDPDRETQIRLELPVNVIEVKEKALRAQNAVDYSEFISPEERARGIEAKVLDPYGYIWALSQAETSNICKLCYCSSSIHLCETLCTHPKTLTWINHVSQMSASVQELRDSINLEEKYKKFVETCNDHVTTRSDEFETVKYHGFPSLMEYMINVYRYMVVIRWAHLIVRFSSKEIGREVYDASERLDKKKLSLAFVEWKHNVQTAS